ncbi:MAG TPA: AAA family ATPase [Rhodothermales bacterium]|nr:AAA family ATPase [Rhodothermales bacterium]
MMFCDLAGSTALSVRLDPEDLRSIIQQYQRTCIAAIEKHSGYTAQYLGDGILAYFGYPIAQEHEADQAVRAGLQILADLERLNEGLLRDHDVQLRARIGAHSGLVVVGQLGDGGHAEHLALGSTPNIAARLQTLASPGTLVVSSATQKLLREPFTYIDLGEHYLSGIPEPVTVFCIHGEQDRLGQDVSLLPRSALVGRRLEIDLLMDRWKPVEMGQGQAVLLCGEPGIGKSNLAGNLQSRLRGLCQTTLFCKCEPLHRNSAFFPVLDMLQRALSFYPGQPASERLDMIEFMLRQHELPIPEGVAALAALMSIQTEGRYRPSDARSSETRSIVQKVLLSVLLDSSSEEPVLLIIDDLHWADPSTLELIGLLLDQIPQSHLFALLTYRPTFQPPWEARPYVTPVTLDRLSPPESLLLIRDVTNGKDLPADVLVEIIRKTDGVPLFIEELTKMVLESDLVQEENDAYVLKGALPPLAVPASLHDSLMARLDRLSPVKELAQLCSVIGREFSYELVRALSPLPEDTLQKGLRQLVSADLIYQQGQIPQATYTFRHALIQDAAYESLLKSRRQIYHRQIAEALVHLSSEFSVAQPELIAHHYTSAGLFESAVVYWQNAGEMASRQSAYAEAMHHFTEGLRTASSADTPSVLLQRIALLAGLGTAQIAVDGYSAPEVRDTFQEAKAWLDKAGDSPHATSVLTGLFASFFVASDFNQALDIADEMLRRAKASGDSQAQLAANVTMGAGLYMSGKLNEARGFLEDAMQMEVPPENRPLAFLGQDYGVAAQCYLSHTLWVGGIPEQATNLMTGAVALARALEHPHSLAFALYYAACLSYHRRDRTAAAAYAQELRQVARRFGFSRWQLYSELLLTVTQDEEEGGEPTLRRLENFLREQNSGPRVDYILTLHLFAAETLVRLGAGETAQVYVNAGLEHSAALGDSLWTSELWRLKGDILAVQDSAGTEAERCFTRAIELARSYGAKSLELRSIIDLAKFWRARKQGDAYALLSDSLVAFNEAQDMAEVLEATQLYQTLTPAPATPPRNASS